MREGRRYGITAFGESMLCLTVDPDGVSSVFGVGAEANVASAAALAGIPARWISRLGDDQAGTLLAEELRARGVEVVADRDPLRQTALCVKETVGTGTRMRYYRTGSAITAFAPEDVPALDDTEWLHLSGIDLALSPSMRAATVAMARRAARDGARLSFDANYRPTLWASPADFWDACGEILPLVDVVFIGDDEAEAVLPGVRPEDWPSALRRPGQVLVLKHGAAGAEYVTDTDRAVVPALPVEVVELTGAADALAAGVLVGLLWGQDVGAALQNGIEFAARAVQTRNDVAEPAVVRTGEDLPPALQAAERHRRPSGRVPIGAGGPTAPEYRRDQ